MSRVQRHYTKLQYTTLQYTTIHYTNYTTSQIKLQVPLRHTNYTTVQLQLIATTALHHATSSSCDEMTTANIATDQKNTTSTTFGSISGFPLPAMIHNNQPLL